MLSARRLTRRFGGNLAVDDVTLEVARGEIVALVGPNGAGKTTTLRMLAGLVHPTSGTVAIDNVVMTPATADTLRGQVGFLTETPGLWDRLTVGENLQTYAGLYGLQRPDIVDHVLDLVALHDRRSTRAAELSKGMRQRVAIARALLHDPPVLLLDEPMSGLDPATARVIRRLLDERRKAGCAILISTHNLAEAERLANRIAVLRRTLIAVDAPAALRQRIQSGHLLIRLTSAAAPFTDIIQAFDPQATVEATVARLTLSNVDERVPDLVRALVERGAGIIEVRPEMADLEEVYLDLIGGRSQVTDASRAPQSVVEHAAGHS